MLPFLSVAPVPFARQPVVKPLSVPTPRSSATVFAASVPSVSFVPSSVAPFAIASVPSATTVASVRDAPRVSVPAPVLTNTLPTGAAVGASIRAATPFETATRGTVSVAVPPTVALARNVTDAAVTAASIVAASPAFPKTAAVESYQSPATPFFDHLPVVRHPAPEAPSFHTYSPASVSSTTMLMPPLPRASL